MSDLDLSLDDCLDLLGAGRNHKARLELAAIRASVEAARAEGRAEERARCVAVVSRIADDVREELRIDSGIVGHTVGQKSHRLDGVDALEDALTAALIGADQ